MTHFESVPMVLGKTPVNADWDFKAATGVFSTASLVSIQFLQTTFFISFLAKK